MKLLSRLVKSSVLVFTESPYYCEEYGANALSLLEDFPRQGKDS